MTANAPHGTTSEYSTCGAESISRVTRVKAFISNHIIFIVMLGKTLYEFVALFKPCGISFEVVAITIMLVRWK